MNLPWHRSFSGSACGGLDRVARDFVRTRWVTIADSGFAQNGSPSSKWAEHPKSYGEKHGSNPTFLEHSTRQLKAKPNAPPQWNFILVDRCPNG